MSLFDQPALLQLTQLLRHPPAGERISTLKAGRGSEVTVCRADAASKRPKKLPICNYPPGARGTRITHLMGFPSPSWFPKWNPEKAPSPPSGPFLFLAALSPLPLPVEHLPVRRPSLRQRS